jgi:hypothetical protein
MKAKDIAPWLSILAIVVGAVTAGVSRISRLEERVAVSEALMVRVEKALEANRETLTAVRVELAGRAPR